MDTEQTQKKVRLMNILAAASAIVLIAASAFTVLNLAGRNGSAATMVVFIMALPVIATVLSFALTAHDLKNAANEGEVYLSFQRGKVCGFLLLAMSLVVLALIVCYAQ